MNYCFDIDDTICNTPKLENGKPGYLKSTPIPFMVEQVNRLYDEGHKIILQTARGRGSGIDQTDLTVEQLDRDDAVLKTYIFRSAWPTTVGPVELSSATADAIETFDVTWRFQHFEASGVNF